MFNEHKQTRVYLLTPRLLSGHESDKASPLVVAILWFLANVLYVSNIVWKKSEWRITKTKWISSITYLFTGLTPFNTFKIPVRISIASLSLNAVSSTDPPKRLTTCCHTTHQTPLRFWWVFSGRINLECLCYFQYCGFIYNYLSTSLSLCKSLNMCVQIENRFLILKISSFNT